MRSVCAWLLSVYVRQAQLGATRRNEGCVSQSRDITESKVFRFEGLSYERNHHKRIKTGFKLQIMVRLHSNGCLRVCKW